MMGSRYVVPVDASPHDSVYGEFSGCSVLGYGCTVRVDEMPDRHDAFSDILGRGGVWRRGAHAIHISGRDTFGGHTGPGFVRALGMYSVEWDREHSSYPSGLGIRAPEPSVIVSWDGDDGCGHRDDRWAHIVHWGCVRGYLTGQGVYLEWVERGKPLVFTPADVLVWIDERRDNRRAMRLAGDRQHTAAVRRLCETMVGVSNHPWPWVVRRATRWGYTFT